MWVTDETATIAVNSNAIISGSTSEPINLAVGSNNITIVVTAQDGTQKTYSLTINRARARASKTPTPIHATLTVESWDSMDIANIKFSSSGIIINDNRATVAVSSEIISERISALQSIMQIGRTTALSVDIPKTNKQEFEVTLPEGTLKAVSDGKIDNIIICTEIAKFTFSPDAFGLESMEKELFLRVKTVLVGDLSLSAQADLPEGAAVIDVNVFLGGESVSKFSSPLEIAIPYSLKEGDNPDFLTVYLLKDDGTIEVVGGRYDIDAGRMVFRTGHFSKYIVSLGTPRPFNDLDNHSWAKNAINSMSAKGYISGRNETEYDPSANISRAEVTTLLIRMLKFDEKKGISSFTDVLPGTWYYEYVQAGFDNGLITGRGESKFEPEAAVTRAELAVIISRIIGNFENEQEYSDILAKFTDEKDIPEWARQGASLTVAEEIIKGSDGYFYPEKNATRAEVAVILYRLLEKIM